MVINQRVLDLIREIVEKNYNRLSIAILGEDNVPQQVRDMFPGLTSRSLLAAAYYHNYLNEQGKADNPSNFDEMKAQQDAARLPKGGGHQFSIDFLNSNLEQLINKQKTEVESSLVGAILDNNNNYKNDALRNLDRPEHIDSIVKEQTIPNLKKNIKERLEGKATSDWARIVNTEVSNSIGQGSVDRIVVANKEADSKDVYVYRINPDDGKTCKWCRRFYLDSDGSPKLYRLSSLLGNGTNYGKKADEWRPCSGATHPNCRDSQVIELRPGWALSPGGKVTYIGLDKWKAYIYNKLSS